MESIINISWRGKANCFGRNRDMFTIVSNNRIVREYHNVSMNFMIRRPSQYPVQILRQDITHKKVNNITSARLYNLPM